MSTIGMIRGLRLHSWQGAVRPHAKNTFATWIAGRWTLPEQERRRGPQNYFKTRRRSASPGLALLTQIHHASTFHSTWNFGFYFASSHSSQVLASLRQVHQPRQWQTRQPNTYAFHRKELSLEWTAPFRLHAAHFNLWTSLWTDVGVTLSQSLMNSTVAAVYPWRGVAERADRALYRSAQLNARFDLAKVPISFSLRRHVVLPPRSAGPVWVNLRTSSLSANVQSLHTTHFRNAVSASHFATTMVLGPQRISSRSHLEKVHRLIEHQNRMFTLNLGRKVLEERRQHSQLTLQLRTEVERMVSRPAMQFVQPAPASQAELLPAIRRMETAVTKFQALQAAPTNGPDIQRLTAQVYDQFERQLRIERERRGR